MQELQNAVVTLCNQHLYKSNQDLSAHDKKMLQNVFGDNILVSNKIREKMIQYKQLIIFLLNDVVLKVFDVVE